MKPTIDRDPRLTICVSEVLDEQIRLVAQAEGRPVSNLVRHVLDEYCRSKLPRAPDPLAEKIAEATQRLRRHRGKGRHGDSARDDESRKG